MHWCKPAADMVLSTVQPWRSELAMGISRTIAKVADDHGMAMFDSWCNPPAFDQPLCKTWCAESKHGAHLPQPLVQTTRAEAANLVRIRCKHGAAQACFGTLLLQQCCGPSI